METQPNTAEHGSEVSISIKDIAAQVVVKDKEKKC